MAQISEETHETHHLFIRQLITKEERKQARVDKVVQQVLGWGIIGILGSIGAGMYEFVRYSLTSK